MTPSERNQFRRALRRLERAVDDKAFQGTIPYAESEAAAEACDAIDVELERARASLINFVEKRI